MTKQAESTPSSILIPAMSRGFKEIPILEWGLVKNGQKSLFVSQLRDALINIGFLYLLNPPVQPVGTSRPPD